jgi:hypothetical protein
MRREKMTNKAKDDNPKLEEFEKIIIDAAEWDNTYDEDVMMEIEQGYAETIIRFGDEEEICIAIWDSLHDYLEKTEGAEYIKKIHARCMSEGEFFRGIVTIATEITAENIMKRLEEQENDQHSKL